MQDDMMLTREQAEALARRALSFSKADAARVNIESGWEGNTRFAVSGITTSGGILDTRLTITSAIGRKVASATTNDLTDGGLRRAVEQSERLARLSPEDPELMPPLGPQQYATVDGYSQRTADLTPEARALAAQRLIESAHNAAGPTATVAGFLEASAGVEEAVANSAGLFAYWPATEVDLSATVRTADGTGSGWAASGSRDWSEIDPVALGRIAAEKAEASRNPQAIEPGRYTIVLEPQAVADLVPLLRNALNARTADEGRSPFSKPGGANKIGEQVVDRRVTLYSDPAELRAQPFTEEGLPIRRTVWIENGVLKNLAYSRFWAEKQGVAPQPPGGGLKMEGGTKSTAQLIAETERGILVTRLWYIRSLDARTLLVTGLTRDGTFLIERGRITRSLKNFRWNESPLFMLGKIEELGRSERVSATMHMPSIRARDFNFASLSDAV